MTCITEPRPSKHCGCTARSEKRSVKSAVELREAAPGSFCKQGKVLRSVTIGRDARRSDSSNEYKGVRQQCITECQK